MKKSTKILTLLISASLIVTFFVPLWFIDLEAPQYPEGLGMQIWLSEIKGDLNTINNLNHYIGMKIIEPQSMAEFKIMPYLIGFISIFGFVSFLSNKKWIFTSWALLFIGIGLFGLVDFYLWEYDYGHDLDPHAAIKVPGMTYQPPLIGSKMLLNFIAHSYPHIGGTIIIITSFIVFFLLISEWHLVPKKCEELGHRFEIIFQHLIHHKHAATVLIFALFLSSCSTEPIPIQYGFDQCALCKMSISDQRYGTEFVTKKGKAYKFDSIECLIQYTAANKEIKTDIHAMYITDFLNPDKLIKADESYFLISKNVPSPMGAYLTGFSDLESLKQIQKKNGGYILNWEQTYKKIGKHASM